MPLKIRRHGNAGPVAIVLHGGPGAPGGASALARGLSGAFAVIEPWQRGSGAEMRLTVSVHVADLHEVILSASGKNAPALVGESWGAMLALAYAVQYPDSVGPIVLVGCGTFDKESRKVGARIREKRIDTYIAENPQHADDLTLGLNDRILKWHDMTDDYCRLPPQAAPPQAAPPFDRQAFTETWDDMLHCQESGLEAYR